MAKKEIKNIESLKDSPFPASYVRKLMRNTSNNSKNVKSIEKDAVVLAHDTLNKRAACLVQKAELIAKSSASKGSKKRDRILDRDMKLAIKSGACDKLFIEPDKC